MAAPAFNTCNTQFPRKYYYMTRKIVLKVLYKYMYHVCLNIYDSILHSNMRTIVLVFFHLCLGGGGCLTLSPTDSLSKVHFAIELKSYFLIITNIIKAYFLLAYRTSMNINIYFT